MLMERGIIRIHLEELIQKSGMSKNKFLHRADMERTQLNRYCSNDVARVDLDVLARICGVLDCTVGELLEFVPNERG